MKHAYLIIAHHDFFLLSKLILALDDIRNDIYVHVDAKVEPLPLLAANYANVYLLTKRIDVRWGDISQIKVQYLLWEIASHKTTYAYYHLLSGVDFPLKSQQYIHHFFQKHAGKEFIGFSQVNYQREVERKVLFYHLFSGSFRLDGRFSVLAKRLLRTFFIQLQLILGLRRISRLILKKGPNWVSITHDFLQYLLQKKEDVLKQYNHTFCADEVFVQTLCWNSKFKDAVYDETDEERGCLRKVAWINNEVRYWECDDLSLLLNTESLFARKFSSDNLALIQQLQKHIYATQDVS